MIIAPLRHPDNNFEEDDFFISPLAYKGYVDVSVQTKIFPNTVLE